MQTVQITPQVTTVLDSSGNGSVSLGPTAPSQTWTLSVIGVRCATNVSESICQVYLNNVLVGTTTWGSTGDSDTDISYVLQPGQVITAQWTGGDAGTTAYLSFVATYTVGA